MQTKERKKPYRVKKPPAPIPPSPNNWNYYPITKPEPHKTIVVVLNKEYFFGFYDTYEEEIMIQDRNISKLYSIVPECYWHYLPDLPVLDNTQEDEAKGIFPNSKKR